jgi:hypothetical protein
MVLLEVLPCFRPAAPEQLYVQTFGQMKDMRLPIKAAMRRELTHAGEVRGGVQQLLALGFS